MITFFYKSDFIFKWMLGKAVKNIKLKLNGNLWFVLADKQDKTKTLLSFIEVFRQLSMISTRFHVNIIPPFLTIPFYKNKYSCIVRDYIQGAYLGEKAKGTLSTLVVKKASEENNGVVISNVLFDINNDIHYYLSIIRSISHKNIKDYKERIKFLDNIKNISL